MQVSVIVPIYNVEKYLKDCLDSLVNQTHIDTDIILVNDDSTDNSANIAREYLKKDPRIFMVNKPNGGLSSARNIGLEFIKGTKLRELVQDKMKQNSRIELDVKRLRKMSHADNGNKTFTHDPYKIFKPNGVDAKFEQNRIGTANLVCKPLVIYKISNNEIYVNRENTLESILQDMPEKALVHFLDSDDYLYKNCLEICLDWFLNDRKLDIAWHSYDILNDGIDEAGNKLQVAKREDIKINKIVSSNRNRLKKIDAVEFIASDGGWRPMNWNNMFRASILNRDALRFIYRMDFEDLTFSHYAARNARVIQISEDKLQVYRVRRDSIMQHNKESEVKLPSYIGHLKGCFEKPMEAKRYHHTYSMMTVILYAMNLKDISNSFFIAKKATDVRESLVGYTKDPYNLRSILKHVEKRIKTFDQKIKIYYFYPKLHQTLDCISVMKKTCIQSRIAKRVKIYIDRMSEVGHYFSI